MSGFGRSTPRSWRRGVSPRAVAAGSREALDVDAEIEADARRFREVAPRLGFCGACGVTVDEAVGKLHDNACPYLPAERRKAVGQ